MSVVKLLESMRTESSEANKGELINAINENLDLNLSEVSLTDKDMENLCSVLNQTTVQNLFFDHTKLSDYAIYLLANALKKNRSVKGVTLDKGPGEEGALRLWDAFKLEGPPVDPNTPKPPPLPPKPPLKPDDALAPVSSPTLAEIGNPRRVLNLLKYMKGSKDPKKVERLREELKGAKNLTLVKKGLDDEDLTHLSEALIGSDIQTLDLSENNFSSGAMIGLAKVIKNSPLQYLFLAGNKITDVGSIVLFNELNHSQLVSLDLSDNQIGMTGISALARIFEDEDNDTLKQLRLVKNKINFEAATQLLSALEDNKTLELLWMGDNELGEDPNNLKDFLGGNSTLKELHVVNIKPINLVELPRKKKRVSPEAPSSSAQTSSPPSFFQRHASLIGATTGVLCAAALAVSFIFAGWIAAVAVSAAIAVVALGGLTYMWYRDKKAKTGLLASPIVSSSSDTLDNSESTNKAVPPAPTSVPEHPSTMETRSIVLISLAILKNQDSPDTEKQAATKALSDILKVATALDLSAANLDDSDINRLASAFTQNSPLIALDLSANHIGSEGIKALTDALATKVQGLESLNLAKNGIGPHSGEPIANMLGSVKLKTLILNENSIGKAIRSIATALHSDPNTRLEVLGLRSNEIDADDLAADPFTQEPLPFSLVPLLRNSNTLRVLDLDNNLLDKIARPNTCVGLDIARAIATNPNTRIERLSLDNNGLKQEQIDEMMRVLATKEMLLSINGKQVKLPLPPPPPALRPTEKPADPAVPPATVTLPPESTVEATPEQAAADKDTEFSLDEDWGPEEEEDVIIDEGFEDEPDEAPPAPKSPRKQ